MQQHPTPQNAKIRTMKHAKTAERFTNKTNAPTSWRRAGTKREKPPAASDEQNNETTLLPVPIGQDNKVALLQVKRGNTEDKTQSPRAEMETERSVANVAKGCLPTSFREFMFWAVIVASFCFAFLHFKETRDEVLVYVILLLVARSLDINVVDLLPNLAKIVEVIHTFTSREKSR